MKIKAYNVSTVDGYTTKHKSPSLAFRKNGTTYYIPLITPNSSYDVPGTNDRLIYAGGKAINVRYHGSTYIVPTIKTTQPQIQYNIPAGTYTPSAFENLIASFISQNKTRTVKNSFSVIVNGETYSVPAGRAIHYTYQYSGQARFVCFSGFPRGNIGFAYPGSFAQYGVYCINWMYPGGAEGNTYYRYNIQVQTGINFR